MCCARRDLLRRGVDMILGASVVYGLLLVTTTLHVPRERDFLSGIESKVLRTGRAAAGVVELQSYPEQPLPPRSPTAQDPDLKTLQDLLLDTYGTLPPAELVYRHYMGIE